MKEINKGSGQSHTPKELTKGTKKELFNTQLNTVYLYLKRGLFTMKMVSVSTDIDRANICWHIDEMKKQGKVFLVRKAKCKITNYTAGYYTTNPAFAPSNNQLKMSL